MTQRVLRNRNKLLTLQILVMHLFSFHHMPLTKVPHHKYLSPKSYCFFWHLGVIPFVYTYCLLIGRDRMLPNCAVYCTVHTVYRFTLAL